MRSSRFTASCIRVEHATWGSLSFSSSNISLYCLQYATAKAEHTKNGKSKSDCFIWTAMLFCSQAVETTVVTGPDLATLLDSKVSGFDRPHVSKKVSDSKVSTLESGFKSFRIRRSDSPDACGRKVYPERKVCGFKNIRIRVVEASVKILSMIAGSKSCIFWFPVLSTTKQNIFNNYKSSVQ